MKSLIVLAVAAATLSVAILFTACGGSTTNTVANTNVNAAIKTDTKEGFRVEFKSEPATIQAGATASLTFTVKNEQGTVVKDLQVVHEKLMHLLIVSTDLAEFYHIHPEPQADGAFKVDHVFPNGGEYRLYADITPKDAEQVVEQINVTVAGAERAKEALIPDTKYEKSVNGLRVVMTPDAPIEAGKVVELNFKAFDAASGKPATDLENYLGALAHFVIISSDLTDYLHVHPMEKGESMGSMKMDNSTKMDEKNDGHTHGDEKAPSMPGSKAKPSSSEIIAHTTFPRPGVYKLWAQFQRGGKVVILPFVLQVPASSSNRAGNDSRDPSGAIKVAVSSKGFEPATIRVNKGEPIKLAFTRQDANNCASEVIFSKLNLRRNLPVGKTVVVDLTPTDDGELDFACGMGMFKGKVIVL